MRPSRHSSLADASTQSGHRFPVVTTGAAGRGSADPTAPHASAAVRATTAAAFKPLADAVDLRKVTDKSDPQVEPGVDGLLRAFSADFHNREAVRVRGYESYLAGLRAARSDFAAASVLRHPGDYAYQAAVFLLACDEQVWDRCRDRVLAGVTARELQAFILEILRGLIEEVAARAADDDFDEEWSDGDFALLEWAAHLADPRSSRVAFLYQATPFDVCRFFDWTTALWLRAGAFPGVADVVYGERVIFTCAACGSYDSVMAKRAPLLIDAGWTTARLDVDQPTQWLCPECASDAPPSQAAG